MNKMILFSFSALLAGNISAQMQIGNSDFETWEAVASDFEPTNWNSFLSAQGSFTAFAANQIEESADVRPGSSGVKSARIWSRSAGFGIIANGNMTLGRINMGSTTANNPANHNLSLTANPLFSEPMTDTPDSIVFWVKYNAASGTSLARMKVSLHDTYDYRDPEDASSTPHKVATAEMNFSPTGWTRMAVAFDYTGPATTNTFILLTFASNSVPGGGAADDEVYIDDVQLIYNSAVPFDTDGDGVIDSDEASDSTDPDDLCSFVLASQTVAPSSTWNSTDCDFDGVSNSQEVTNGTDPLVNNNISVNTLDQDGLRIAMDNTTNVISVLTENEVSGEYAIYNTTGQMVQAGAVTNAIAFDAESGIYFMHLITISGSYKFEIYKK
jgi:hypothetical protein